MTMLSTNHNSSLSYEDLENFSPMLIGWRKYFFTGSALICVALAFLVQRAVHRSLKQLGTRPINQMIIPSQVNMNTVKLRVLKTGDPKRSQFTFLFSIW